MRSHADWLRAERMVAAGIIGVLVTIGVFVVVTRSTPDSAAQAPLHGPAVALYGSLLASTLPRARVTSPALLFALLGITHPVWMMPIAFALPGSVDGSFPLMLLVTGAGLCFPLIVAAERWWPVIPMGAASVVAAQLAASAAPNALGIDALTLGAAPLHLTIAWTMFAIVVAAHRSAPPAWACACCGYDLRGSVEDVCPECGADRRPAQ